ncbi:MAG: class I SAM-dependent methyltransferase [Pseudomonadota bacterium]
MSAVGQPPGSPPTARQWEELAGRAAQRLASVDEDTDLVRLFHGRGRLVEGLEPYTVDLLGSVVVLANFAREEIDLAPGARALRAAFAGSTKVTGIMGQQRRGRATRGDTLWGEVPDEVYGREAGLRYLLRPSRNQNVGLFLDAAPARAWVREQADGARVLNLFSYTCAFSVAALAGGARAVVNNDMSRTALDWGRVNHDLNGMPDQNAGQSVTYLPHNLLKSWWKIRKFGPFDLVVIDPPTNQRGSFNSEKQYSAVLKRLPDMLNPGAHVVACLNSPFLGFDFLPAQVARWCDGWRSLGRLSGSADFADAEPERALKVELYRVP